MSSARGERMCALMLATLATADQRAVLASLPEAAAARIRGLRDQLERLGVPLADVAQTLLADEVAGLTSGTSLDVQQLMGLADRLPDVWYARVLTAWGEVDRSFCVSLLERPRAANVARELAAVPQLPPRLAQALKAEAVYLASPGLSS